MDEPTREDSEKAHMSLMSLLRGYRAAQLLFVANRLGIFEALTPQGARTDDLAAATGVPSDRLCHVLGALKGLGILDCFDGLYFVAPPYQATLNPYSEDFLGSIVDSAAGENTFWSLFAADILRGEYNGPPYESEFLNANTIRQSLRNVEISNRQTISSVWPYLTEELRGLKRFLDVGGGHGSYSLGVLERVPGAEGQIFDIAEAIEYFREQIADNPHASRMACIPGDARSLAYIAEFDLVFVNDLLVYFSLTDKREILLRASRALMPGGHLVMVKISLDPDRGSPAFGAMFSINMAVTSLTGYLETDVEAVALCREVGLREIRLHRLSTGRSLIIARK
ncbi:methyltransferase [Sinorhizobium meliloti]|uniref:methyltransferase n=1 Tax=Rhizobium meliloti TaxID=382 RepID=UPI003D66275A